MFNPRLIEHDDAWQVQWYENENICNAFYANDAYGHAEALDFIHTLETVDSDPHTMEWSDTKEENLQ